MVLSIFVSVITIMSNRVLLHSSTISGFLPLTLFALTIAILMLSAVVRVKMPPLVSVSWQELAELGMFCNLLVAGALVTGLLAVGGSKGDVGDITLDKKMLSSPGIPAVIWFTSITFPVAVYHVGISCWVHTCAWFMDPNITLVTRNGLVRPIYSKLAYSTWVHGRVNWARGLIQYHLPVAMIWKQSTCKVGWAT